MKMFMKTQSNATVKITSNHAIICSPVKMLKIKIPHAANIISSPSISAPRAPIITDNFHDGEYFIKAMQNASTMITADTANVNQTKGYSSNDKLALKEMEPRIPHSAAAKRCVKVIFIICGHRTQN